MDFQEAPRVYSPYCLKNLKKRKSLSNFQLMRHWTFWQTNASHYWRSLRISAILCCFCFDLFIYFDILINVVTACGNKVPQVREGTLNWISRAMLSPKQIPNVPKCVKPLANMLVNVWIVCTLKIDQVC